MLKALTEYTNSLEVRMKETLPGLVELDEDAIHDFRVAIKKTRTVLNFLEYMSYKRTKKRGILKEFRPVFKKTGLIRELQMCKKQLPELEELSGLEIMFLEKKLNYHIIRNKPYLEQIVKKFRRRLPYIFKKIHTQIKVAGKGKTRIEAAADYQIRLARRIQKQVYLDKPNLHRIRKSLKQQVYVFDAFQESELLSFYKEFRAEWKILETTIGKWHDKLVFRDWLIPGLKWKRLTDQQYKIMIKLIAYLRRATERMEKELVKATKAIGS
jgi:CHAD domain-containing protein